MTQSTVSDRKAQSNRENASKSTGPRSQQGKKRSSRNAISHGYYCREVVLPGENLGEYKRLRLSIIRNLNPQDEFELTFIERIAVANWRLRRFRKAEGQCHESFCDTIEQQIHKKHRKLEEKWELVEHDITEMGPELYEKLEKVRDLRALQHDMDQDEIEAAMPAAQSLAWMLESENSSIEKLSKLEQRAANEISRCIRDLTALRKSMGIDPKELPPGPFAMETDAEPSDESSPSAPSPATAGEGGGEGSDNQAAQPMSPDVHECSSPMNIVQNEPTDPEKEAPTETRARATTRISGPFRY